MVMGQKSQLWADVSPRDSLELFAAIYDIPKIEYERRLEEFCVMFNVTHLLGVQVRRLSLGERMKFELISALIHKPKLLLLDEPTIGLDLIAKEAVRKFLATELTKQQVTVILSSHDMEDIQEVCNQLMIVAQGELKYFGRMDEFGSKDIAFKQDVLKLIAEPVKA
jgi:ABC-2 type transport system ATP-binding protein